jgi:ankyrin repeat protein
MTRHPIRRTGLVLLSLLLPLSPLSAEDEKDLRDLLRDALYTEEVTRDPEAAAKQYETLLSQHDAQRAFAASALFRLAEVRRKQDREDEAIALYQKLLVRFPEAETEAKLAREKLTTLGAKPEETQGPAKVRDYEQEEIERVRKLAAVSPDLLPDELVQAANASRVKLVEFLLSQGVDTKSSPALGTAAEKGNLAICKILLKQDKPSPEVAGNALAQAARYDRIAILNFLLEQGLDANSPVPGIIDVPVTPLFVAVDAGNFKATTTLLDHGADIDFMISSGNDPGHTHYVGTPLHLASRSRGGIAMVRLLLDRGAKPDLPMPVVGATPLHLAVGSGEPDNLEIVKELLVRGADPNLRTTLPASRQGEPGGAYAMVTPFEFAFLLGAQPKIEALLAKGANPNFHDSEGRTLLSSALRRKETNRIELLLRSKADPNVADKDGATPLTLAAHAADEATVRLLLEAGADPNKPTGNRSPLDFAIKQKLGWPIVELLMAKGAKPEAATFTEAVESKKWDAAMKMLEAGAPPHGAATGNPWTSPLVVAMKSAEALPLIEKMIEKGAKPEDGWIEAGFRKQYYSGFVDEIPRAVRSFLFRRFMLLQMEENPAVRVVIHGLGETKILVLDDPSPPLPPRSLAQSLLEPTQSLESIPKVIPADRATVWRKSGESWTSTADFPLDRQDEFPALLRGDVVEITEGQDPASHRGQWNNGDVFSPELRWSLRKRVSFPVTVEIDGKAQEVTLRGDRLIFDPSRPEIVPLAGARQVMQYLWQPEIDVTQHYAEAGRQFIESMEIVIKRDGWPDVRLPYRDSQKDFPLRSGDRLAIESPKLPGERIADIRKHRIVVKAASGPFAREFGELGGNNEMHAATVPTLLQAVAEVCQISGIKGAPEDPVALRTWLLERGNWQFAYVQRPDLSKIRIRRLQEDGTEKSIDLDLAKVIAATPGDASIDEVRKTDVELRMGDIVEISSLPTDDAKPWAGLSLREESFFSKALSCRIQVTDPTGNIRVQEIRFRAPKIVSIDAGSVPLPVPEAVSSLRGSASLQSNSNPTLSRKDQPGLNLSLGAVFLREGDRIIMPSLHGRPPSQRVLPPAPR